MEPTTKTFKTTKKDYKINKKYKRNPTITTNFHQENQ